MPNTRLMLWIALAAILYLNYEAWMHDYREPAPPRAGGHDAGVGRRAKSLGRFGADESRRHAAAAAAAASRRRPPAPAAAPAAPPGAAARRPRDPPRLLHVVTDVLDLDISLQGRRDRPRRSAAVSAAQGHAERSGAAREPRPRHAVSVADRSDRRAPARAAPTHLATWTSAQRAPTCCRRRSKSCACR